MGKAGAGAHLCEFPNRAGMLENVARLLSFHYWSGGSVPMIARGRSFLSSRCRSREILDFARSTLRTMWLATPVFLHFITILPYAYDIVSRSITTTGVATSRTYIFLPHHLKERGAD